MPETLATPAHSVNTARWPVLGIHAGCGGTVRVKDWRTHDEWRYEAYCTKCLECDPNGYGSRKETITEAAEYFGIPLEQVTP